MTPQCSSSSLQEPKQALSLVDAQSLFNEIINDSSDDGNDAETLCMISGKLLDVNAVTLPCGHKFDYLSLLADQVAFKANLPGSPNRCPYCRQVYNGCIPYRADLSSKKARNVNTPVDMCFEKHACYFEKSGQSCTINATVPIGSGFACWRHYKGALKAQASKAKQQLNSVKCKAILKSGKGKGNVCGATVKEENSEYCKRHTKA